MGLWKEQSRSANSYQLSSASSLPIGCPGGAANSATGNSAAATITENKRTIWCIAKDLVKKSAANMRSKPHSCYIQEEPQRVPDRQLPGAHS
jgi:hypothetical protein